VGLEGSFSAYGRAEGSIVLLLKKKGEIRTEGTTEGLSSPIFPTGIGKVCPHSITPRGNSSLCRWVKRLLIHMRK